MNKHLLIYFVGAFLLLFIGNNLSLAVLPPDVYKEKIENSKIKAIAEVKEVKIIETTKQNTYKLVKFKLKEPLVADVPGKFTGHCYSVDFPWQTPGVGPILYYYPHKGELVHVTISEDGGDITSYQSISEEDQQNIIDNFKK